MGFDFEAWRELLLSATAPLHVRLTGEMVQQFARYGEHLLRWNRKFNLTAITDPRQIALKHFADSLVAIPWLAPGATILDMGSGAGFPGLCLKIVRSDLKILLIDASRKRVSFLKFITRELDLTGIQSEHTRAENLADDYRGYFDVAVSRAVAPLNQLARWSQPWLNPAGRLMAWKGPRYQLEIEELEAQSLSRDCNETRWKITVEEYQLHLSGEGRALVIIERSCQ